MRRGIATALVADATAIARARGATCLEVTANGHALDFYVAVGFVEAGIAETTFGPAVRMRLDLGSAGDSRKWRQRRC
jgi:ribosomal protein S18 acetylase RimI-like enzyme